MKNEEDPHERPEWRKMDYASWSHKTHQVFFEFLTTTREKLQMLEKRVTDQINPQCVRAGEIPKHLQSQHSRPYKNKIRTKFSEELRRRRNGFKNRSNSMNAYLIDHGKNPLKAQLENQDKDWTVKSVGTSTFTQEHERNSGSTVFLICFSKGSSDGVGFLPTAVVFSVFPVDTLTKTTSTILQGSCREAD